MHKKRLERLTMNNIHFTKGWTLVELMITVAIIGLLASIAIPAYNGYISTADTGVIRANAETLAGFEDIYFYESGTYLAGTYEPPATDDLTVPLGWVPASDQDNFKYVVAVGACGDIRQCMTVTVSSIDNPTATLAVVNRP